MGETAKGRRGESENRRIGDRLAGSPSRRLSVSPFRPLALSPFRRFRGFTYVEILITLSLLAILFLPMMQLFSSAMEATNTSRDLITAVSLARWEMERAKNVGVSTSRLKALGDTVWPPTEEPPLALNGRAWRVYRLLAAESDPLQVTVEARREQEAKAVARLMTLVTDTFWGQPRRLLQ